ncbi:serine hydrolase domain-containing protein [Pseudomonas indica]|uniref:CubicO group peptidase, beta-lactamase class C family n=1 Tax=Pseudomonas indica TaxID=137658 RepID=A0A1G9CVH8_9PSED|nr:serine hydrolase [Pseudomonas indica]SDK55445.1 CubicO group peptidase, beta-lactamase class C family [Pseudomonas indica]
MPRPFSLLLGIAGCFVIGAAQAFAEAWPDDDWPRGATPTGEALAAFESYAFPERDEVSRLGVRSDAVVVIRDGELIYERYAGETRADTPHLTWSVSKSLLASVLGVAYGEGRFRLDDPAARYYPAFSAHPQVSLRHLLNWSSGLAWQEDYEYAPVKSSVVAMLYTQGRTDMAAFTAAHAQEVPPGQHFRYSSGDSNVLAAALKGVVGAAAYPDYPWTALFEPLGIRSAVWETDAAGTFVGSSYTYLTARDLARVGLLMQRDGRWHDRQLLPRDWVAFNRTPAPSYRPLEDEAVPGGHWWLNARRDGAGKPWPNAPEDTFAALGHWGQALYVLPAARLVIVRYADDRDASYRHDEFLKRAVAAFARETGQ